MCYGFRAPTVEYNRNSYLVHALLNDPHSGDDWYPDLHLHAEVDVGGKTVNVNGCFRHKKCSRMSVTIESFANLTCPNCSLIPLQNDFTLRIGREDRALLKRGHRSIAGGIRLGYLSTVEISKYTRNLA